jgi:hypothetical protein
LWTIAASSGDDEAETLLENVNVAGLLQMPGQFLAWTIRDAGNDGKITAKAAQLLTSLAQQHPSPITRLGLASACQRLSIEQRKPIVAALLAHGEDAGDQNLPLMDWYAAEPIVGADATWAAEMLGSCKIPLVNEFIARRLAE